MTAAYEGFRDVVRLCTVQAVLAIGGRALDRATLLREVALLVADTADLDTASWLGAVEMPGRQIHEVAIATLIELASLGWIERVPE